MGQGTGTSDPSSMLGAYSAPLPSIMQKYMDNLSKGSFLDMPSYSEMFGAYKDVANKAANEEAAKINESLGSMGGGRYSSAVLNSQNALREKTSTDLANVAAQYQAQLRGMQSSDVLNFGGIAYGANEAGMNRMWGDFLRRTSPPPLLDSLMGLSQGYGLPATVVA